MFKVKKKEELQKTAEVKVHKNNKNAWYKDKKVIGTIVLILAVAFQLFAFLKVPFFTTIHGYTIGMMLGWYNPFFYLFTSYVALVMIFGEKIKLPKWVKLNNITYWIVVICIAFIGVATGYYQTKEQWTTIGIKSWDTFDTWFHSFAHGGKYGAWTPANTNGGVIGVFFYSLFTMISSGIGSFFIAIICFVICLSFIISGSSYAFYKNLINKKKITLQQKEIKVELEADKVEKIIAEVPKQAQMDFEDPFAEEEKQEEKPKPENEKKSDFPFDDPFDV